MSGIGGHVRRGERVSVKPLPMATEARTVARWCAQFGMAPLNLWQVEALRRMFAIVQAAPEMTQSDFVLRA